MNETHDGQGDCAIVVIVTFLRLIVEEFAALQ